MIFLAEMDAWVVGVLIFLLIVALVFFVVILQFVNLWIQAFFSGVRIGFMDLIGMKLRKVPAVIIVNARIQASRAGLDVSQREMESHLLAGGDEQRVISSMIAANKANIDLAWKTATAIDRHDAFVIEGGGFDEIRVVAIRGCDSKLIEGKSRLIGLQLKAQRNVRTIFRFDRLLRDDLAV